jgi:hypothetical protein
VEQGERISLKALWYSLGVASGESIGSGCAHGWKETNTPFSGRFNFSSSDKYFHTLCNTLDAMIEYLCLCLSLAVFEHLIEMLIFFYKLLYLHGL